VIQTSCTIKRYKSRVRVRNGGVYAPKSNLSQSSAASCGTKRIRIRVMSVRPSGVDRAWEIPSEHKRQIVVSRSPFIPPFPLLHHHLLLPPPTQEHRIFAIPPLVEIHGSHQGKITTSFTQGSPLLTDFLAICQQTARKSTGGG